MSPGSRVPAKLSRRDAGDTFERARRMNVREEARCVGESESRPDLVEGVSRLEECFSRTPAASAEDHTATAAAPN
jgi:hypothetical protein